MKYGLYEEAKNTPIVEKGIDEAISVFIQTLKDLNKKYQRTGMTDTEARMEIVQEVSNTIFDEL